MKENRITKTVEEVNGYFADDGQWFRTKEECQKYEESAKMVVFSMIKDKIIAKTTIYGLFNEGCEDSDVEIYNVDSLETVELLNRYVSLSTYDNSFIFTTDMVGKNIIIAWTYDRDYCWTYGSIEDLLADIKKRYEEIILNATE